MCGGLVDLRRGLDDELHDLARILVLGLLGVSRSAEGVHGGLVGQVAVAPIVGDVVNLQADVDAHRLLTSGPLSVVPPARSSTWIPHSASVASKMAKRTSLAISSC